MTGFEKEVMGIIEEVERAEEAKKQEKDEEIIEKLPFELEEKFLAMVRIDIMNHKDSGIIKYELPDLAKSIKYSNYVGEFAGIKREFSSLSEVEEFAKKVKNNFASDSLMYKVEWDRYNSGSCCIKLEFILDYNKIREIAKKSH